MSVDLASALTRLIGDGVETAIAAREAYAIGSVTPSVVATPGDCEALRACVSVVGDAGAALIPLGYGAHRALGHEPRRYDVALVCAALASIRDYTPADMTVTVEAGLTVAALQEVLAREGQWLPLDPPCPAETTIGGLVAADLGGPLCGSQGRVRDFVIGLGAVMADGRLIRAGGKVVKNVAGYDLMKLLTGSLGTLAVLTEVTLKVRPRPAVTRCLVFELADADAGIESASALAAIGLDALAMTVVAEGGAGGRARLVVLLAGVDADVAAARRCLEEHVAGVVLDVSADEVAAHAVIAPIRDFVRTTAGDVVVQIVALPDAAGRVASVLAGEATRMQFDARSGRTVAAFATTDPARLIERVAARAATHGAHVVLERWPLVLAGEVEVWRPLPASLALMRRMKTELDPRATLAPGRFVGGI